MQHTAGMGKLCAVVAAILLHCASATADWRGDALTFAAGPVKALPEALKTIGQLRTKSARAARQFQVLVGRRFGQSARLAESSLDSVSGIVSALKLHGRRLPRSLNYESATAVALAAAIRAARNRHYPNSRPLPAHLIAILSRTIPMKALKRARYAHGDLRITLPNVVNSAQRMFATGNHAMVVDDVIVFAQIPGATTPAEIRWWAHEVHHVYQYMVWGVDKFAFNYVANRQRIERRARTVAAQAGKRYRALLRRRARLNVPRR